MEQGTLRLKTGLAEMLKGGVIMDVTTPEQAKIAEEAGACAVMALERVPADIRAAGGVARMADPTIVKKIMEVASIPVMAKARIGHFVEARVLEALGVDYIDESEVLTPADDRYHIDKRDFTVPFVCGCRNLGEALRRIAEGAAMIRTKGEPGTGNVVEAVRHCRQVMDEIRHLCALPEAEVANYAKEIGVTVCLENMPFPELPLAHVSQITRFVDALGKDNLKVCLDTGHANVCGTDIGEAIRMLGDRLAVFHIHDNDGKNDQHRLPGTGTANFGSMGEALAEIGFSGVLSSEARIGPKTPHKVFHAQARSMADTLTKIKENLYN